MQNQTGKEEDGACQADPGPRHPEGLGGEGQRGLKPGLWQRKRFTRLNSHPRIKTEHRKTEE